MQEAMGTGTMDEQDFDKKITKALQEWAQNYPDAAPILLPLAERSRNKRTYTASELAREIADRTTFGQKQLDIFRHFARTQNDPSGDQLVAWIRASATLRQHQARG